MKNLIVHRFELVALR